MTVWILIFGLVVGSQITGTKTVLTFDEKPACLQARIQFAQVTGTNISHTRCVEFSLGEPV